METSNIPPDWLRGHSWRAGKIQRSDDKIRQRGVTLILAVVLLAATTFLSFALSVIVLREIRGARLILQTEPAISGANAGGEIGLYQFVRQTGLTTLSGTLPVSQVGYEIETDLYDSPYAFEGTGNVKVSLYDAVDPDNQNADYGSVSVKNIGSDGPIRFRVFSWSDPVTPVCNWSAAIPNNQTRTCSTLISATGDDRFLVEIERTNGDPDDDISGEITALANNLSTPKGIPSGSPTLDVTGSFGDVQRKIEINLQ